MRHLYTLLLFGAAIPLAQGQVHVDRPVVLTAADSAQRQVQGLADPGGDTHLTTLGAVRSGAHHWCTASATGANITLSATPALQNYAIGTRLRFLTAATGNGGITLNVDGNGPRTLRSPDGLPVVLEGIPLNTLMDVEFVDTAFVLISRQSHERCPQGYLAANGRLCLQVNENAALNFYDAGRKCLAQGARLCSWTDYLYSCTVLTNQLNGLFDNWEWIDDTSDHTHTADQAGRYNCRIQRSIGALPTETATFRCCYDLK